ncbi:MAG: glycosyltransferase family 4 protein [Elusimicrobia bacterium]|nr:glycosyltransferase family 4 protein [Elusimicrobiota bacterium]
MIAWRIPLLSRFRRVTPRLPPRSGPSINLFANLETDWILNTIAEAIVRESTVPYNPVHHPEWERLKREPPFRDAAANLFIHYALYRDYLRRNAPGADIVFFTHFWPMSSVPAAAEAERLEVLATLRQARLIVSMSSHWKRRLVDWGIPEGKISVQVVGSDASKFTPGARPASERPVAGMVSSFKDNKNSAFIRDLVLHHVGLDWVLLGRNWERSTLLDDLAAARNFRYLDMSKTDFGRWPEIYRGFDLFVSPSTTEGGPVPLLEAMLTGVWPIATDTGHASDVIRPGESGFLFPPNDLEAFGLRLQESLSLFKERSEAVRRSALPWSWERFGRGMDALIANNILLDSPTEKT